ncbi:low molecular weight protein arginine phosphatase [Salibacterium salarium]|uniref:Low molecular weight protein arginine phosphatase n=1 Tax=Salibacterium salarium TaxID=284579 RepID=A0A428MU49_9BACI|nr:low molecular weight protein arginine phosphatase [Salibacterium salarium]RSL29659.1 low molecular weight protein arginine phosphatase [Salibacterium salarium]
MKHILFVCTGNTCRSPLAEALLQAKGDENIEVQSAGVSARPGMLASKETVAVLKEREIPLRHASRPLNKERMDWADIILTMTKSHHELAVQQFPEAADKIFTIKEFAVDSSDDIVDPIGGTMETYRKTAEELDNLMDAVLEKLKKL